MLMRNGSLSAGAGGSSIAVRTVVGVTFLQPLISAGKYDDPLSDLSALRSTVASFAPLTHFLDQAPIVVRSVSMQPSQEYPVEDCLLANNPTVRLARNSQTAVSLSSAKSIPR